MILLHELPALQVVIPLVTAPLCMLVRRGKPAWLLALLATWAAFMVSTALLGDVIHMGPLSYAMGNWQPPMGIEYRVDTLNAFILFIITGIASICMLFALRSVEVEVAPEKQALFYCTYLLCLTGLLGIVITNDAFNIYVFLEISSLATYTLIAMGKNRLALTSAFNYLILGTIGATFILIGIGLLYMMTGTLNISDLAQRVPPLIGYRPVQAAFAFLTVGLSLKIALFPLHMWLPKAYTHSPSFVSAFLAATATKVGIYALLRFVFTLFGEDFSFERMPLAHILVVLSVMAILAGSTIAIFQRNLKTMLAWSSIAQIGYITLGIGLANPEGLAASLTHIANHAVTKGALFLAVGCMAYRIGRVNETNAAGLGRTMPLTSIAFVLAGLSLIGVPFSAGFVSKWMLLEATLEADAMWLAVLILFSSLLAVIYIWRVIELLYFKAPQTEITSGDALYPEAPMTMQLATWILAWLSIWFGFNTTLTADVARTAADLLFNGGLR